MAYIALYWSVMIVFYIVAIKFRKSNRDFSWVDSGMIIFVYILCLLMGMRMGANEDVTSQLGVVGLQAVLITLFAIAGSMFAVTITRRIMKIDREGVPHGKTNVAEEVIPKATSTVTVEATEPDSSGMKTTLIVLAMVVAGMLLGYFAVPALFEDPEVFQAGSSIFLTVLLCVLLAFVGFSLGISGSVAGNIKNVGLRAFVFPVVSIIGALGFSAVYSLLSPLTLAESLASTAGFGWYSLAPGLIIDAGHVLAGAICFVSNVLRETLGIIFIPLAARKLGALEAISIPGVAAMDVCLPIVGGCCRTEALVYSFVMGLVLCLAAPLLVAFFIN